MTLPSPDPITLLLDEISARGWYVYSWSQEPDNRASPWEASLRHPSALISHGSGSTAYLALSSALDRIELASPHTLPTYAVISPTSPRPSLSDLLLLLHPRPKLDRRI